MKPSINSIVVSSPTRNLSRLHAYVTRPKRGADQERFVAQTDLNGTVGEFFPAQARRNRQRFDKDGTRTTEKTYNTSQGPVTKNVTEGAYVQGYHVIQSFAKEGEGSLDPNNPEDVQKAHEAGVELAQKIAGKDRMATVVTQVDGASGMLHNHIIIDSISTKDGKSFGSSQFKHSNLRQTNDQVLSTPVLASDPRVKSGLISARPGYEIINKDAPARAKNKHTKADIRRDKVHDTWKEESQKDANLVEPFSVGEMKRRIQATMNDPDVISLDDFKRVAEDDYLLDVRFSNHGGRLGVSYGMYRTGRGPESEIVPPTKSEFRTGSALGGIYSRKSIAVAIERNRKLEKQRQVAPPVVKPEPAPLWVAGDEALVQAKAREAVAARHVPVETSPVFVSGLHQVQAKGNDKTIANNLAKFEDTVMARPDASFTEAEIPRGATKRFLDAYGDSIEPVIRDTLYDRALKADMAARAYDLSKQLEKDVEIRMAKLEKQPNTYLARQVDQDNRNAEGLQTMARKARDEISDGNYTVTACTQTIEAAFDHYADRMGKQQAKKSGERALRTAQEAQDRALKEAASKGKSTTLRAVEGSTKPLTKVEQAKADRAMKDAEGKKTLNR